MGRGGRGSRRDDGARLAQAQGAGQSESSLAARPDARQDRQRERPSGGACLSATFLHRRPETVSTYPIIISQVGASATRALRRQRKGLPLLTFCALAAYTRGYPPRVLRGRPLPRPLCSHCAALIQSAITEEYSRHNSSFAASSSLPLLYPLRRASAQRGSLQCTNHHHCLRRSPATKRRPQPPPPLVSIQRLAGS